MRIANFELHELKSFPYLINSNNQNIPSKRLILWLFVMMVGQLHPHMENHRQSPALQSHFWGLHPVHPRKILHFI